MKEPCRWAYFGLRLPQGWWLLGTDVQLDSDIDGPQFEYFAALAKRIPADGKVILVTPEPHWVYDRWNAEDGRTDAAKSSHALRQLENLLGARIKVHVAGDAHHYMAYSTDAPEPLHWITCGGGGAFLHPTHGPFDAAEMELPARWQAGVTATAKPRTATRSGVYPEPAVSRAETRDNLWFMMLNSEFGIVPAIGYLIVYWVLLPFLAEAWNLPDLRLYQPPPGHGYALALDPLSLWIELLRRALFDGLIAIDWHWAQRSWVMAGLCGLVGACYAFVDDRVKGLPRLIAGTMHGVVHFLVASLLAALAAWTWLWQPYAAMGCAAAATLAVFLFRVADNVYMRRSPSVLKEQLTVPGSISALVCAICVFMVLTEVGWGFLSLLITSLLVFSGAWIAGSVIFGLYLLVMLNEYGCHWNEALSAVRVARYKSFLRMVFDADGTLSIYPLRVNDPTAEYDGAAALIGDQPLVVAPRREPR